jgi:hypothetical protein
MTAIPDVPAPGGDLANGVPIDLHAVVGTNAGRIWGYLMETGEASTAKVGKALGLSSKDLHRAIGWLAREGKLVAVKTRGGEKFRLA